MHLAQFAATEKGPPGATRMAGTVTITAAGAILSQDGQLVAGFKLAKNAAAGRYSIQTHRQFKRLIVEALYFVGPTAAAFGNVNANALQVRNVDGTGAANTAIATADSLDFVVGQVQAFLASTGADTDLASGSVLHVTLVGYDI